MRVLVMAAVSSKGGSGGRVIERSPVWSNSGAPAGTGSDPRGGCRGAAVEGGREIRVMKDLALDKSVSKYIQIGLYLCQLFEILFVARLVKQTIEFPHYFCDKKTELSGKVYKYAEIPPRRSGGYRPETFLRGRLQRHRDRQDSGRIRRRKDDALQTFPVQGRTDSRRAASTR